MADIAYKRDIDRLVAKELGWDVDKVKENSNHLFRRIKKLMDDPEIDQIILSHIGTMYVKTHLIKVKLAKTENTEFKPNPKLVERMERYDRIFVNIPYNKYKKYHGRSRILNTHYTKKKNFLELQKFQNGED